MHGRVVGVAAVALALLVLVAACGGSDESEPSAGATTDAPREVQPFQLVGISPQIQPGIVHIWIGDQLGYYEEQGLRLEYEPSAGATDALQRLIAGNADATIGTTDALFAQQKQGVELPLAMFYQYSVKTPYQLAVAGDSELEQVADLAGKKIGVVSLAETGYFYAQSALGAVGVDPSEVDFVVLGQGPALLNALQKGQIDAIAAFRQLYAIFANQGYEVKLLPQPDERIANIGNVGILARDDAIAGEKRDMLVGYGIALAKSTIFAIENPDAACRVFYDMYPETLVPTKSFGENVEDCKRVWAVGQEINDPAVVGHDRWGEIVPQEWEQYASMLGMDEGLRIDELYTNDLIDDINAGFDEEEVREQARTFCEDEANRDLCERE